MRELKVLRGRVGDALATLDPTTYQGLEAYIVTTRIYEPTGVDPESERYRPDEERQSVIAGELADLVRLKCGFPDHVPVFLVETASWVEDSPGNWSYWISAVVEVAGHWFIEGDEFDYDNPPILPTILEWALWDEHHAQV